MAPGIAHSNALYVGEELSASQVSRASGDGPDSYSGLDIYKGISFLCAIQLLFTSISSRTSSTTTIFTRAQFQITVKMQFTKILVASILALSVTAAPGLEVRTGKTTAPSCSGGQVWNDAHKTCNCQPSQYYDTGKPKCCYPVSTLYFLILRLQSL